MKSSSVIVVDNTPKVLQFLSTLSVGMDCWF